MFLHFIWLFSSLWCTLPCRLSFVPVCEKNGRHCWDTYVVELRVDPAGPLDIYETGKGEVGAGR